MKLELTSNEMCALMILSWAGPLTPFGVGSILPEKVRNSFKWKSGMSIKKEVDQLIKRLKKENVWGNSEFEAMVSLVHFYKTGYYIEVKGSPLVSIFTDERNSTLLKYCGINKYVVESMDKDISIKKYIMDLLSEYKDSDAVQFKVFFQDKNRKIKIKGYSGCVRNIASWF